jgi:hypothetical protein
MAFYSDCKSSRPSISFPSVCAFYTIHPSAAARLTAYDIQQYLVKPFLIDELLDAIAGANPTQQHR